MAIVALILSFLLIGGAQAPSSEESIWKQYFAWLQEGDFRQKSAQNYRAKLIAGGLTEADADAQLKLIENQLAPRHREELTALQFNKIYTAPVTLFNIKPNAFLASTVKDLKPGTALDVAMGQGRNALYLASLGWTVTGFDIADQGLAAAQAEASRLGLRITTIRSNHQDFDFGREKWDLIVFSYAWVPIGDPAFVSRVQVSLKPAGMVVIEAPAEDPLKPVHLREWKPEPTDEINTLVKIWVAGFRILRYEDTQDMCDWRNRKARILRLVAQKW